MENKLDGVGREIGEIREEMEGMVKAGGTQIMIMETAMRAIDGNKEPI